MKIHLKDNKIALYDIESDYRQYLFQYDFRVNLKSGRRFVGIIVGIEDYTYFIPLTSKPLRKNGKTHNIGRFKTIDLAFQAYKNAKEDYIKEVAELYKDQIDIRVYEALMKYEVSINDWSW